MHFPTEVEDYFLLRLYCFVKCPLEGSREHNAYGVTGPYTVRQGAQPELPHENRLPLLSIKAAAMEQLMTYLIAVVIQVYNRP